NSEHGPRIKTYDTATGASVNNILYQDITLQNITSYGIVIRQDYRNTGPTGTPGSGCSIKGVQMINVHGDVSHPTSNDGNLDGVSRPVYILCANCANFTFKQIAITGGTAASHCEVSDKILDLSNKR
ncbi:hypothetical protein HK096_005961, partial [Nowakowskiella sp. JEL0078]